MEFIRYENNPIITPKDVKPYHENHEVIGAFNAGIAEYNGETLMLLRVAERPISEDEDIVKATIYNAEEGKTEVLEFNKNDMDYNFDDSRLIKHVSNLNGFKCLTSLSYLRIARSKDGVNFKVDEEPFIYPSNASETFGVEDARISKIDDTYYITYTAVSPDGVGEAMVSTKDFKNKKYHGMIFAPENKDVILFPEKINGKYYALHRPSLKSVGDFNIWIAESENLNHWGNHKLLLKVNEDNWDSGRIGAGLTPIKTEKGWLEIYHGATKDHRYCMGAVLLDLNDPTKVIARTEKPIIEPKEEYERNGFFGGVVFGCGHVMKDNIITMYYGVSDTSMACGTMKLEDVLEAFDK